MHKIIREISSKNKGAFITCNMVLDSATILKTKSAKPSYYLQMTFVDGYDTIGAKIWNVPEDGSIPEIAKVYTVEAIVDEYNKRKQLVVSNMALADNQDLQQFTPHVAISTEDLTINLQEAIDSIKNSEIKSLVNTVYKCYWHPLLESTSAEKMHHVGIGGNIMHTLEVFNTAVAIAISNRQWKLDVDLIKAGALLHDIGKAFTYKMEGPVINYTETAVLLDHIMIGVRMLDKFRYSYRPSLINILQHIILSHHGVKEYGSPVVPHCAEALVVSFADNVSAKLDAVNTAFNRAIDMGERMTEKIYVCENAEFFTPAVVNEYVYGE